MKLSITSQIVLFWSVLLGAIVLICLPLQFAWSDLLQFLPVLGAVYVFKKLKKQVVLPRWLVLYGRVVLGVVIMGVPIVAIACGPSTFPPIYLVGCLAGMAVYLVALTIFGWKQRVRRSRG